MPPPKDLWRTFVKEENRPGFPFPGWENVLGNKRCFHIPGFTEACEALGLNNRADFQGPHSKIPLPKLIKRTKEALPSEWIGQFGKGNPRQEKEWRDLTLAQIMMCYKRQPMLLQKAAMSLVFLEQLVVHIEEEQRKAGLPRKLALGYDVYKEILIDPAVYYVRGFDRDFYEQYLHSTSTDGEVKEATRSDTLRRLKRSTGQEKGAVFDHITRGKRTCLYGTAIGIINAFGHFTAGEPQCKAATSREFGTPSQSEIALFPRRIPQRSPQG
jgi:hypothetical protein